MPVHRSADSAGRVTPATAAEWTGASRDTVIRWCETGLLPGAVQLPSGRWRIPLRAIAHLIPADAA